MRSPNANSLLYITSTKFHKQTTETEATIQSLSSSQLLAPSENTLLSFESPLELEPDQHDNGLLSHSGTYHNNLTIPLAASATFLSLGLCLVFGVEGHPPWLLCSEWEVASYA